MSKFISNKLKNSQHLTYNIMHLCSLIDGSELIRKPTQLITNDLPPTAAK